jgi:TFIIF-interacting CTD phosphatase-like protein
MAQKMNLILDLDNTLISTFNFNFYNNKNTEIDHINDSMISILHLPNFLGLVYIRPHLYDFLEYIFTSFNISIWTASSTIYCREVLKMILTETRFNETIVILARDNNNYVDIKTNKIYKNVIRNNIIQKPLDLLWNDIQLSSIFTKENTLIIDNNSNILVENPYNSLVIQEFTSKSVNDTSLCTLINWLKIIQNVPDITEINKDIYKL